MTRHRITDFDNHLNSLECPPQFREALTALHNHFVTCGPARWRGLKGPEGWRLTLDRYVRVWARDTDPGEGIRARIAHAMSEPRRDVLVDSLESVTALFPRITQAYALAQARPLRGLAL